VTLAVAAIVVLAVEVEVAQPFRVPTSSMEPTLHCAKPGIGCTGSLNDRVIVAKLVYRWRDPRRFEIAVFHAPPRVTRHPSLQIVASPPWARASSGVAPVGLFSGEVA